MRLRAERLGALHDNLYLAAESDLGAVLGHLDAVNAASGDITLDELAAGGNLGINQIDQQGAGDVTVRAFRSIGWGWGGTWSGARDYMHFSATGR